MKRGVSGRRSRRNIEYPADEKGDILLYWESRMIEGSPRTSIASGRGVVSHFINRGIGLKKFYLPGEDEEACVSLPFETQYRVSWPREGGLPGAEPLLFAGVVARGGDMSRCMQWLHSFHDRR